MRCSSRIRLIILLSEVCEVKWVETTLRKGTKTPKICRDMFIADSRGVFNLCELKNGRPVRRELISQADADKLIQDNYLVGIRSMFAGCLTYRTHKSNRLVVELLAT